MSGTARHERMAADWIAVDWGTTNLRAWAMSASDEVLAQAESAEGMGGLDRADFEGALLRLVGPWLNGGGEMPVFACGMVGSRQGWVEAPYRSVPCRPMAQERLKRPEAGDARLRVMIVPGLKQTDPADVMRGEETQIAGYLAVDPDFDGVVCLPGTHTKWVRVCAREVVSFQTFLTGELFSLLSRQSVLRHGVSPTGWDEAEFAGGVDVSLSRPERIAARLFSLRAEGLLNGLSPVAARSRLSGLLIGMELAAARPYWLGQSVTVIGAGAVGAAYRTALATQGVSAEVIDGGSMTLAGLAAARAGQTAAAR